MYTSNDPKVVGRSYVNQAIGAYNSGDNYGAQVYLARAIISDPDLKNDPEVRTLASKYTGLDVEAALKRLTTPARNSPRSNDDSASDGDKGGDQWFVVLLELIVLFVTLILTFVLIQSSARQFAADISNQLGSSASQQSTRLELQKLLANTQPAQVLQSALGFGGSTIIGLLIWNVIMYAFCIAALGGAGGILAHMSIVFRVEIVSYLLYAALIFMFVLSFRAPVGTRASLIQLSGILLIVNSLGTGAAMIYFIGEVHKFGTVKGFVAVVLMPFILGCGLCGLLSMARLVR